MFKIRNEFEKPEKRKREDSRHSPDISPILTQQKAVKKKMFNLGQYLEPFSIYNISDTYELRYILQIYKTIECDVYEYNLDKRAFQKNTYRDLCVEFNYSSAQKEVYDMFGIGKVALSFTLIGQNSKKGISSDSEDIINNLWKKHMYVETDNFGNYKKIVIFKHNAPKYEDFEDQYNSMQQDIVYKETKLFNNIISKKNYQKTPSEYKHYVDKLGELFQNLPVCYPDNTDDSSDMDDISDMDDTSDMDTYNDEIYGGHDAKITRLKKYRSYLKKQSIEKLQNIAKNKSINYKKKYKGKMVNIKTATLIEKIYQHFCNIYIQ